MSLFAPLLKPHTRTPATTIARHALRSSAHGRHDAKERREKRPQTWPSHNGNFRRFTVDGAPPLHSFEDIFVGCLVAAGSCTKHRASPKALPLTKQRPRLCPSIAAPHCRSSNSRPFSSRSPPAQEAAASLPTAHITKDEYIQLVNTYPAFHMSRTPAEGEEKEKQAKVEHYRLAPRLVVDIAQEERSPMDEGRCPNTIDTHHLPQLKNLCRLLRLRLGYVSQDKLWTAYQDLPSPRLRYLSNSWITRLLAHLSWVEHRDKTSMTRYFDVLHECVREKVPLPVAFWNTGIAFAGSQARTATGDEVKAAIETWMQMEEVGHQATNVTFNILFHTALRAGRFALAETILNELKARKMPLDRYLRIAVINLAGKRRDGEAVRQAFRDLVNNGDIVDTSVMNCVIVSLLRAGEAPAAENTFLRMKTLHETKFGTLSPKAWQSRKELAHLLRRTGDDLRKEKLAHEASFFGSQFSTYDKREVLQKASPIAPDAMTYRTLIQYHAYTSGDIDKIRSLLGEMQERGLHIHGSVYVHFLRGFSQHGGYAFSSWNRNNLEILWVEILASMSSTPPTYDIRKTDSRAEEVDKESGLIEAMLSEQSQESPDSVQDTMEEDDGAHDPDLQISELDRPTYMTGKLALAAVRAFYKCTGRKRMQEVWKEILLRSPNLAEDEKQYVQRVVNKLIAQDNMYIVD